jgi:hypothetical protein
MKIGYLKFANLQCFKRQLDVSGDAEGGSIASYLLTPWQ